MTKKNKIIYWIFTIWLALGMASSAVVQLLRVAEAEESILRLGYPKYLLTILGIWKILGVITVLAPGFLRLKEWAYAGFFFTTSGAAISHIVIGDPFGEIFPALLLLTLTVISWYFRPENRKMTSTT